MAVRTRLELFLALTLSTGLAAQAETAQDPLLKPTMSKSDLSSLNKRAATWVRAELAVRNAPDGLSYKRGARLRDKLRKARDAFLKTYNSKSKKSNPIANVGNALAMFGGAFEYKRQSSSGEVKYLKDKDLKPRTAFLGPKKYDYRKPHRTILQLPGLGADGSKWIDARNYVSATWKGSSTAADTLVVHPEIRAELDFEMPADLGSDKGNAAEFDRIRECMLSLGHVQREYHVDRRRVFLDCGKGSGGFGLRLVTYFPDRFAGLILRHPGDPGKLRLDNLRLVPVLLVANEQTKAACEEIKKRLTELDKDAVVVVVDAGSGEPGDKGVQKAVDDFVAKHERPLFPKEVTVVPNHNQFLAVQWVRILKALPLDAVNEKERPFARVRVDRKKNQVILETKSVEQVGVYLNDALLDLDKEVTFVINGKEAEKIKFERNLTKMFDLAIDRFDASWLFPVYHGFEIPNTSDK